MPTRKKGDNEAAPLAAEAPRLHAKMPAEAAFAAIAHGCLRQLQGNVERGAGSDDPEYVHQMRVALRRLRTAIKLFAPVLGEDFVATWDAPSRELAQRLGEARNWDIFATRTLPPLAAALAAAPTGRAEVERLAAGCAKKRAASRRAVARALAGEPYRRLMVDLVDLAGLAATLPPPAAGKPRRIHRLRRFAVRRLIREAEKTRALAAHFAELDAAGRHRLRIACKRLRYALEFFAPLLPARKVKPYRRQLAELQDVLGEANDLAVAGTLLAAIPGAKLDGVADGFAEGFAAGWLAARLDSAVAALPERIERFLASREPWR